jgi:hypothetical protein
VIAHGNSGFLHAPEDLDGMAESAIQLLTDKLLHRRIADTARRSVHNQFCDEIIVPVYEAYYEEILAGD